MSVCKPIQALMGVSALGIQRSRDMYRIDWQVHWCCPQCPQGNAHSFGNPL